GVLFLKHVHSDDDIFLNTRNILISSYKNYVSFYYLKIVYIVFNISTYKVSFNID
ncbi:hypothetical protein C1645_882669, partial [Glomus cerebriforme]